MSIKYCSYKYIYRKDGEKLKMISNRKFGPGSLTFTAYESIKVGTHSYLADLRLFYLLLICII